MTWPHGKGFCPHQDCSSSQLDVGPPTVQWPAVWSSGICWYWLVYLLISPCTDNRYFLPLIINFYFTNRKYFHWLLKRGILVQKRCKAQNPFPCLSLLLQPFLTSCSVTTLSFPLPQDKQSLGIRRTTDVMTILLLRKPCPGRKQHISACPALTPETKEIPLCT